MTLFLADEHFPSASVRLLRAAGHHVLAIAEGATGNDDRENLALAVREGRIILTFDRDYGALIYRHGLPAPPAVIYFRLTSPTPDEPAAYVLKLIGDPAAPLAGQFVTVGRRRIRRRPLP